jgi:hypothetical protein
MNGHTASSEEAMASLDLDFELDQREARLGADMAEASETMARACSGLTAAHDMLFVARRFADATSLSRTHRECVRAQQEIARVVRALGSHGQSAFRFRAEELRAHQRVISAAVP